MAGRNRPQGNGFISGAAAIGGLPRRRVTWPTQLLVILGLGTIAVGLLSVVGKIAPAVLVGIGAALLAVAFVVFGIRAQQRGRLLDTAIEAISPILGARTPNREIFQASKWSGGWIGLPGRVRMRYAATVDDIEPGFVEGVIEQINRRLGAEYRVLKHLPKSASSSSGSIHGKRRPLMRSRPVPPRSSRIFSAPARRSPPRPTRTEPSERSEYATMRSSL